MSLSTVCAIWNMGYPSETHLKSKSRENLFAPLRWLHNERDGVSNHQPHDCLLNRLFKEPIKENIKAPRHWPLWGNSPATGGPQRASNAEKRPLDDVIMHNLFPSDTIVLKFYTEHDSTTVALCVKRLHNWTIETDDIDKRDFARLCCANRISVKYA